MWFRCSILGDLFSLEMSTTTDEGVGITGGSGHNFERAVEVDEYFEPEERLGFHVAPQGVSTHKQPPPTVGQ
jgi:hypothetical protein